MNQRPIMPEDLLHYRWISQPVVSPNGQVAYVEQTIDQEKTNITRKFEGFRSMVMKILHFRMVRRILRLLGRRMAHSSHSFALWMEVRDYGDSIRVKRACHADLSRT